MRTVMIVGDTHIHNHQSMGGPYNNGINRRCEDILRVLTTHIHRHKPGVIFQLGDFFDNAKPTPAVYYAAMKLIQSTQAEWHILAGNHDIASFDAPSAVRPLAQLSNVHVYETPTVINVDGVRCGLVPYCSLDANSAMPNYNGVNAVLAHYGLGNAQHQGPDYVSDAWQRDHKNVMLYCGHEHSCYYSSMRLNVGSMCQNNFDSDGHKGRPAGVVVNGQIQRYIGPVFCDYGKGISDVMKLTHVYARVKPEDRIPAEREKKLGVLTDYKMVCGAVPVTGLQTPEQAFQLTSMEEAVSRLLSSDVETGVLTRQQANEMLKALETL